MFLSLTATPGDVLTDASDLGHLLHKHPARVQAFSLSVGEAHVFWPEATPGRAEVAVLLEVDPIGLQHGHFVNDRPYAAGSMLAVALGQLFRTAMNGFCKARPELPGEPLALEVRVPSLQSLGGPALAERMFAPLGWAVEAPAVPLDPELPAWGDSRYVSLTLRGTLRLADALTQLYVLLPVLDDAKHYWVGQDEVDKLLRAGGTWLSAHPERDLIVRRYLTHRRELVGTAVGRLAELDDTEPEQLDNAVPDEDAAEEEAKKPLALWRKGAVLAALAAENVSSVVDLGCGGGALLRELIADSAFAKVTGVDVSHRALELAARRLRVERMTERQQNRLQLLQSSVTYRDDRIAGHDAVVLMEVIEHLDLPRLPALERNVFGHAAPRVVVVTTPNSEYNVRYEGLAGMRHTDHRFEWTRAEFAAWSQTTAAAYGYEVRLLGVGDEDPEVGAPSQLAVFRKDAA